MFSKYDVYTTVQSLYCYPDSDVLKNKLGRSLHVRHLDAGSCNACDFEMGALSNSYYDLHRYGVAFVASPRLISIGS